MSKVFGVLRPMLSHIFPIPVNIQQSKNWITKKTLILQHLSEISNNISLQNSVYTDYHFNIANKIHHYPHKIKEWFYDELLSLKNELNVPYDFTVLNAWFELSNKGNYHNLHNHGKEGYSAVCYINYNPEIHHPLVFQSAFLDPITGKNITYSPLGVIEGTIIFFPSSLDHYTIPNKSNEDRLVLSFNLRFKKLS
jgi:hypothetical protein